jgi:hypothetical protein
MKYFWIGLAFSCIAAAAISLWQQQYDAAFVIGTIGVVAWFLNYRARLRKTVRESKNNRVGEEEFDSKDES